MSHPPAAAVHPDDWDAIWGHIAAVSEQAPATHYRRDLVLDALAKLEAPGIESLLELGCGTGAIAEILIARYPRARYLGLDLSRKGIEAASRRLPGVRFVERDLLEPAAPEERSDFGASHAVCMEVLEHLDDPVLFLRHAAEYMRPGCRLVVSVPGGPKNAFDRMIGHRRHFRPWDLAGVLEAAGYRVNRAWSAGFPFFDLYRLLLLARGKKLMTDVSGPPTPAARLAMRAFAALFRLNSSRRGFQTLAVATWEG